MWDQETPAVLKKIQVCRSPSFPSSSHLPVLCRSLCPFRKHGSLGSCREWRGVRIRTRIVTDTSLQVGLAGSAAQSAVTHLRGPKAFTPVGTCAGAPAPPIKNKSLMCLCGNERSRSKWWRRTGETDRLQQVCHSGLLTLTSPTGAGMAAPPQAPLPC